MNIPTVASREPFRNISYPVTPMLSVYAFQERSTRVGLIADPVRPLGVEGGIPSGVVTEAVLLKSDMLPAPSRARTWYW